MCTIYVTPTRSLFFVCTRSDCLEYRPVPLEQTFIGVTDKSWIMKEKRINMVCLKNLVDSLNRGHQVLIFVHSRKATSGTLNDLLGIARNPKELAMIDLDGSVMDHFSPDYDSDQYSRFESKVRESRSREVQNLFQTGMGIHHAGKDESSLRFLHHVCILAVAFFV